ncbi:MAG: UDP-N-acetylmuramate dehydrogenase [Gammaproteobacteria bacterium]|nr:UDP-N-acetylmuramate dehydrogenase [Gammaproteobacteria bacterium]MDE0253027.1 UDP-N-acetylmuramate dehydrogenase [Gammaproteobacteria bacterium]MDE0402329.1 UDP-N-acetylmuramate dehydrogenase [Gammaproteobacteria bacterium]
MSLTSFNSLGVESKTSELVHIRTLEELERATEFDGPLYLLGEGTNVVLLRQLEGRTLKISIRGVECIPSSNGSYKLRVGAGENWHRLVAYTLHKRINGLENLALIPGSAGAAPFQNIGAYGRELSRLIESVEVFDIVTRRRRKLSSAHCSFGYRTSVFRTEKLTRCVITHVNLVLGQQGLRFDYIDLQRRLNQYSRDEITARRIAAAVIQIRRNKLPDWRRLGNVGSFFKNPVVKEAEYRQLNREVGIIGYPFLDKVRIPAARLIEVCGWKGRCIDGVEVWAKQPLVLVNRSARRGVQFLTVATSIANSIKSRFDIDLELEPVVLGRD